MDCEIEKFQKIISKNNIPIYIVLKFPNMNDSNFNTKIICVSFSKEDAKIAIINDIFEQYKYKIADYLKLNYPGVFDSYVQNKQIIKYIIYEKSSKITPQQSDSLKYGLNDQLSLKEKYCILNDLELCGITGFFEKTEYKEQIDAYAHENFHLCYVNIGSNVIYKIKKSIIYGCLK